MRKLEKEGFLTQVGNSIKMNQDQYNT